MFSAIADGFNYLFGLIWTALQWLLNGLTALFRPVFDFLDAIGYFLYKLGVILYKVLELVVSLGKMLIGLGTGLLKTITGLSYTASAPSPLPSAYSEAVGNLQPIFAQLQLDKVAYLVTFAIWIMTAIITMRLIGGMRGGGSNS